MRMAPVQSQKNELEAFIHFFKTFELSRPLATVSDFSDGAVFFDILALVDDVYFRQPRPPAQPSENWVLRFSALKRLYRLMTQYFADVLQKPTTSLDVPDLQAIANESDITGVLGLCRLTVVIGVQCERNKEFIVKIQGLSEGDQHVLMKAIEQVMGKIGVVEAGEAGEASMTEDDHYYRVQSERSQLLMEKQALEKMYHELVEQHRLLQTTHDDMLSEKDEALAQLRSERNEAERGRNDKADVMLRAELDRVRVDLQKSEDNLAMAESELDKSQAVAADLTRRVEELQEIADEASKMKDQLDEYRHAADKLHKTENVMQKYKKKLQESADLRHQLKAIEQQNSDLVNKNAALEEDYRKVAAFKPLMESYKSQIADLENKHASKTQEMETLKFELDQTRTKLKITQEERSKDAESLELYQERVRELELNQSGSRATLSRSTSSRNGQLDSAISEDFPANVTPTTPSMDMEDGSGHGLGEELDDAIAGRTTTDLKLQIKKLERELENIKKNEADASRILVLENLLDDAQRTKTRYENDYLAAHREKLILQRDLDEIRSGKALGDGPEAAIALRQRLNESVDQLDALRKEHAELEVKYDTVNRELTIAKSDLTLVNKDQLDILASLRESVNEDKMELEADVERLKKQNKELNEKNRMQLEQVNSLLMEKMNLQTEGIGHREKLLLQRDLNNELNSVLPGNIPEEFRQRWLTLHEDSITQKETIKGLNEKLIKAKQVLKLQDKLLKEGNAANLSLASQGAIEEAENGFRAQVKALEEEVARERAKLAECNARYAREHELMTSYLHNYGMRNIRNQLTAPPKVDKTSFLGIHRSSVRGFDIAQSRPQLRYM